MQEDIKSRLVRLDDFLLFGIKPSPIVLRFRGKCLIGNRHPSFVARQGNSVLS